jgi:hypothetical protein
MSKQLKQVINLSKKTGDRIIVFDNSEPDNSFVVMTLDQYENLIEKDLKKEEAQPLTEKKIIDKIESTENNEQNNSSNRNFRNNNWQIPPQVKQESEE